MNKKQVLLALLILHQTEGGLNFLFRQAALRKVVGSYRNFFSRIRRCSLNQLNQIYDLTLYYESLYRHGQLHCGVGV